MNDLQIPLIMLTPGEDVALGRAIEAGVYARHLLALRGPDPLLERVSEWGSRAEEVLWWVGLRIARRQARRLMRFSGLPGDDLFQEAGVAVARAIRAYDHTRGVRFSTFVWHVVQQGLNDASGVRITGGRASRWDGRARRRVENIRAETPGVSLDTASASVGATVASALRGGIREIPLDEARAASCDDPCGTVAETGLDFLELLEPLHRDVLVARYLRPDSSLAAVGASLGVSGTTVLRWEREACRAARQLLSAERTELPSISRDRPPEASSCASRARSTAQTGRGARSGP